MCQYHSDFYYFSFVAYFEIKYGDDLQYVWTQGYFKQIKSLVDFLINKLNVLFETQKPLK